MMAQQTENIQYNEPFMDDTSIAWLGVLSWMHDVNAQLRCA